MQRASKPFTDANYDTIKCLSLGTADALFSTYMAVTSYEPGGLVWWKYGYDAVSAVAQLFSCVPPPIAAFEEAFGGDNLRCQCAEVAGELFLEYYAADGTKTTVSQSDVADAKEIRTATVNGTDAVCTWITVAGLSASSTYDIGLGTRPIWYIVPTLNTGCCIDRPVIPSIQPYPTPYIIGNYDENCGTKVELLDSCIDRFGLSQNFYYVIDKTQCTGGGTDQYYYWESVTGPFIYSLFYTAPGFEGFRCQPPYAPPHPHAAEPTVFASRVNPGLSAVTYTLDVGCTYNPETGDFDKKFPYNVEQTAEGILGLARRMDALAWMINNAALIPYTECNKCAPVLDGEWVTVRFESLENSPQGTRPLRKLFRYRSLSALDLGQRSAYWENFTWNAGAICVQHKGASWGTPQCWASNADEGKRVIRFAGLEAGIDPDVTGEWVISGSTDPRYGQPGSMRVAQVQGLEWVTSRQGPSGLPLLTVDP
tara:strand:- start:1159 stop:2601 length:1443 start_codon:yes stop_codon:yes gene_type:complete